MNTYLLWLMLYSVVLVSLGLLVGRMVRTSGAFFVAGRKLNVPLLFSTLLAANIGAGSTVGAAGLGFQHGLAAWWWVGSFGIGSLVLAFWVGPAIWRIAREHQFQTVGDFLEHRYGVSVRGLVASILWLGSLAILAGQLIAAAKVLEAVAGLPKWSGCLLAGLVMVTYFSTGGLLTSAWVNLVQLIVMFFGFLLAIPYCLEALGGLAAFNSPDLPADFTNFVSGGDSGWVYVALLVPAFIVSPGLLQKIFGARDARTVRIAVSSQGLFLLLFAFVPPFLGMSARVLHPGLSDPELALPTILVEQLPMALGALGLAAVLSAELSSADAILFMLSTSLARDLYARFVNPDATDRDILRAARWAALGGGTLGVGLAMALPTVISSLSIFYSVLGVTLLVPILAGLYLRRAGLPEAMSSILAGVAVFVACHFGDTQAWTHVTPVQAGLAASGLALGVVLIARHRR